MKCKECEWHVSRQSPTNGHYVRGYKYHDCLYPIRDTDGAILALKSVRSLYTKDIAKGSPGWCPYKLSIK